MLKKLFLTNLQGFDMHIAGVYCKPCLQPISCYIRKMLMNKEMACFQKCDFLRFSVHFTINWVTTGALYSYVPIEYIFCFLCSEKSMRNISSRKYIDLF